MAMRARHVPQNTDKISCRMTVLTFSAPTELRVCIPD